MTRLSEAIPSARSTRTSVQLTRSSSHGVQEGRIPPHRHPSAHVRPSLRINQLQERRCHVDRLQLHHRAHPAVRPSGSLSTLEPQCRRQDRVRHHRVRLLLGARPDVPPGVSGQRRADLRCWLHRWERVVQVAHIRRGLHWTHWPRRSRPGQVRSRPSLLCRAARVLLPHTRRVAAESSRQRSRNTIQKCNLSAFRGTVGDRAQGHRRGASQVLRPQGQEDRDTNRVAASRAIRSGRRLPPGLPQPESPWLPLQFALPILVMETCNPFRTPVPTVLPPTKPGHNRTFVPATTRVHAFAGSMRAEVVDFVSREGEGVMRLNRIRRRRGGRRRGAR